MNESAEYGPELESALAAVGATLGLLIVESGSKGNGFAASLDEGHMRLLPMQLRIMARVFERAGHPPPSKYQALLESALYQCGTKNGILVVFDGVYGSGFAAAVEPHLFPRVPAVLNELATRLESTPGRAVH